MLYSPEAEFLLSQETSVFALKAWIRSTYTEGNFFYFKSTANINHINKIPLQQITNN